MNLSEGERAVLLGCKLFEGTPPDQLDGLLERLCPRREVFPAGALALRAGEQVTDVGVVLAGSGRSLTAGAGGEPLIVSLLEPGSFIGILLAASRDRESPVSVQAQEEMAALFLPADRLTASPLLPRFLDSVAQQSLALTDRISCLIRRSVREKVSAYLLRLAAEKGADAFTVPLDRNAMANYLNVERSALSRELSRMRADGLIDYRKNSFHIRGLAAARTAPPAESDPRKEHDR